jgi:hypothetical protein
MRVIKVYVGKEKEPRFYEYRKTGSDGWMFDGWVLVSYPLDKPAHKRESKWLDPKKIKVEWIKEFV